MIIQRRELRCCFGEREFLLRERRKLSVEVGGLCLLYGLGVMRDALWMRLLGMKNTPRIHSMANAPARYHVVFSMKSFVRRTPITWLAPPN